MAAVRGVALLDRAMLPFNENWRQQNILCCILILPLLIYRTVSPAMPALPRPTSINIVSRNLLQSDLLTPASPYTPVTPSSGTALGIIKNPDTPFVLSAPPTPTFSSSGTGVLVKMSDGQMAVRTFRKTLRIEEGKDAKEKDAKEKGIELVEGTEVDFKTDGVKAFEIRKRVI